MNRIAAVIVSCMLAACSSAPPPLPGSEEKPSSASINAQLGLSYMKAGNLEVAEVKLLRALAQDPELVETYQYLAELYSQKGMYTEAEDYYRQALRRAPQDASALNNYGAFLCGRGRYQEAERQFLKAVDVPGYRQRDEALENAALCMMRVPDAARAEQHLRQAVSLNPRRGRSLLLLAQLSFDHGDLPAAQSYLNSLGKVAAPSPESLWLGVRVASRLGETKQARELAEQLKQQFPESAESKRLGMSPRQ
ncbi:MAG: type IV pilus biogenesis/stability protein PilW [Gammaproteobacteria bacterium]|nr:type IV pilus biogenesis/stability protein PilW [Gammaproteobacteria bacterium]